MTGVAGAVACGLALLCHLVAGGGVDLAALARGDGFIQTPLSIKYIFLHRNCEHHEWNTRSEV
jgi:hypothetical protein